MRLTTCLTALSSLSRCPRSSASRLSCSSFLSASLLSASSFLSSASMTAPSFASSGRQRGEVWWMLWCSCISFCARTACIPSLRDELRRAGNLSMQKFTNFKVFSNRTPTSPPQPDNIFKVRMCGSRSSASVAPIATAKLVIAACKDSVSRAASNLAFSFPSATRWKSCRCNAAISIGDLLCLRSLLARSTEVATSFKSSLYWGTSSRNLAAISAPTSCMNSSHLDEVRAF
mmetsp:Transcript_71211/g.155172  ORF Transcript_71211/g.155172 Transcript_71211/m.155172 type:complete len:231 (+) Transcript_71211:3020-3712(+)